MKLIRCKKCNDVVRLIHSTWRQCECGKSGGQYNDDMLSATVGGKCEVIGIRNDFFTAKPFSDKRQFNKGEVINMIVQGEYLGDVQIHRIQSGSGPKLKMRFKKVSNLFNEITFTDNRPYTINLPNNKSPKKIKVPYNPIGPSFKKKIKS